jgi:hypothetical protein
MTAKTDAFARSSRSIALRLSDLNRSRSARYALCVCIGIATFTGCSSTAKVIPSQGGGFARSSLKLVASPIAESSTQSAWGGNETIDGSGGQSQAPYCTPSGRGEGIVSVSESGSAIGRYSGTFNDAASFYARCELSSKTTVNGTFSITSGPNAISGTFYGAGTSSCGRHPWGETCGFGGKKLTYSASLIRGGKVRKHFSGSASATIGTILSDNHMNLTLKSL